MLRIGFFHHQSIDKLLEDYTHGSISQTRHHFNGISGVEMIQLRRNSFYFYLTTILR